MPGEIIDLWQPDGPHSCDAAIAVSMPDIPSGSKRFNMEHHHHDKEAPLLESLVKTINSINWL